MEKDNLEYSHVDDSERGSSLDSEGEMLMPGNGKRSHHQSNADVSRSLFKAAGAVLFLSFYTIAVVLLTRRAARSLQDDPTYGGKIVKCKFTPCPAI